MHLSGLPQRILYVSIFILGCFFVNSIHIENGSITLQVGNFVGHVLACTCPNTQAGLGSCPSNYPGGICWGMPYNEPSGTCSVCPAASCTGSCGGRYGYPTPSYGYPTPSYSYPTPAGTANISIDPNPVNVNSGTIVSIGGTCGRGCETGINFNPGGGLSCSSNWNLTSGCPNWNWNIPCSGANAGNWTATFRTNSCSGTKSYGVYASPYSYPTPPDLIPPTVNYNPNDFRTNPLYWSQGSCTTHAQWNGHNDTNGSNFTPNYIQPFGFSITDDRAMNDSSIKYRIINTTTNSSLEYTASSGQIIKRTYSDYAVGTNVTRYVVNIPTADLDAIANPGNTITTFKIQVYAQDAAGQTLNYSNTLNGYPDPTFNWSTNQYCDFTVPTVSFRQTVSNACYLPNSGTYQWDKNQSQGGPQPIQATVSDTNSNGNPPSGVQSVTFRVINSDNTSLFIEYPNIAKNNSSGYYEKVIPSSDLDSIANPTVLTHFKIQAKATDIAGNILNYPDPTNTSSLVFTWTKDHSCDTISPTPPILSNLLQNVCYGPTTWNNLQPLSASTNDNLGGSGVVSMNFHLVNLSTIPNNTKDIAGIFSSSNSLNPPTIIYNATINSSNLDGLSPTGNQANFRLDITVTDKEGNISNPSSYPFSYGTGCVAPFIKTQGGDIHSNTQIQNSGGQ